MAKEFLGVRIDAALKDKLDKQAKENAETVTELTERALATYLQVDISKPDVYDIEKRLRALESQFQQSPQITPKKANPSVNLDEIGELITLDEMEALTGYAKTTLSSKLSRAKVAAVKRKGGNRGGLYSKSEILERIGIKEP